MTAPEKISAILASKRFTRSVEVFPPRNGKDPSIMFRKLDVLREVAPDWVSITKGAMGSMRGGTTPIGYMIADRWGMNPLVHFRARDLTRREVENQLMDHHYFQIRNVLAVMGDPLPGEESPQVEGVHHRYASELVAQIAAMNRGEYLPLASDPDGTPRKGIRTDFCIGVAVYPEAEDAAKELSVAVAKQEAGACFGITQLFFEASTYFDYVDRLRSAGVTMPIVAGVRPVLSRRHLEKAQTVFKARIPPAFARALDAPPGGDGRICSEATAALLDELRSGGAPGVHLFILNDVEMARTVFGML